MALSHGDRFKLKSQLVDALDSQSWATEKVNLLFGEFGLEPIDAQREAPSVADVLGQVSESTLVELYAVVFNINTAEVEDAVESSDATMWKAGYVRLFLSHSAQHKTFVGEVADELAVMGVHGFVAHDTMEYSKPWQEQIERALRSMQAFVTIIHHEFNGSAWCNQEVGWALGRRVPNFAVRMGADPSGFPSRDQWPSGHGQSAKQVAATIYGWVAKVPELGGTITDGLLEGLTTAGNYYDAEAAANRIAALGTLDEQTWARLDATYWANDQVCGGVLPTRVLEPFYRGNGRDWPPAKPI